MAHPGRSARGIIGVLKKIDLPLFILSSFLSFMSILTIFGSVENFGRSKLVMQVAMTLLRMVTVLVIANLNYKFIIDRFAPFMLAFSVLILGLTLIFGISGANIETTNKSWLVIPVIGIAIQPSEFVKMLFVCTFAKHLELVKDTINKPKTLLFLMLHAGLPTGLVLLSGDLGVALVYIGIILLMLFASGLSGWYFLGGGAAVALAFPFIWDNLELYQQQRIIFGFRPELDPFGKGMQALMSRSAIENGGFFGRGLFGGSVYEDLAASHTDFIFATVCEKFGFVGGFLVIAAIVLFVVRLVYIAIRASDDTGRFICIGIAAMMILQTAENIGMCLALIPVIGITLPFMSAGGSSVLALYMMTALAHSVAAREKRLYFRR